MKAEIELILLQAKEHQQELANKAPNRFFFIGLRRDQTFFLIFIEVYSICGVSHFSRVRLFVTLMDCSPPDSFVPGILQVRILAWVAMPSSRGSSQPRIVSASLMSPVLAGKFFTTSTTSEAHRRISGLAKREESGNTWDLSLLSSASACSLPECTNFSLWEWCCLYLNFWDGGSYNMQFKMPQFWT